METGFEKRDLKLGRKKSDSCLARFENLIIFILSFKKWRNDTWDFNGDRKARKFIINET